MSQRATAALGKNASISSPPLVAGEKVKALQDGAVRWVPSQQERETRYRMRAANWDLTDSRRQQKCGRCRRQSDVLVMMRESGGHFSGLVTCGSVHCCPVCSAVIQVERRISLQEAERNAHSRGYGYAHVTVTARHGSADDPRRLYEAMSKAWSFARSGAPWQRWKDRIGFLGTIRATDATVGDNGLHVHFHVALVTSRPLTDEEMRDLRSFWFARYSRKLEQLGCVAPLEFDLATGDPLAIHMTRVPHLGDYLAKLPLAWELTASQTKAAARGSRTMWEVLRDCAEFGRKRDRDLWRAWTRTMHGKNSLVWSKGLKALLLDDPDDYQTDEAIAADADAPNPRHEIAIEVGRIPGVVWDHIAHDPGAQAAILASADAGGQAVGVAVQLALDLGTGGTPRQRERFAQLQRHQDVQNMGEWIAYAERDERAAKMGIAGRDEGGMLERSAGGNWWVPWRATACRVRDIPGRGATRIVRYEHAETGAVMAVAPPALR